MESENRVADAACGRASGSERESGGLWRALLSGGEPTLSNTFGAVMAGVFVLVVAGLEGILPAELSLKPLYVGGVVAATVCGGAGFGLAVTLVGWGFDALASIDTERHMRMPHEWIAAFNLCSNLIYMLVAFALSVWGGAAFLRERRLSQTDLLTQIPNRLGFYALLEAELAQHGQSRAPMTLAYIDCDNFKSVNDTYGHDEGDRLLCCVARTMRNGLRRTDCPARLGGDEFAVVLTNTDRDGAQAVIEKLVGLLQAEMLRHQWEVTFSIGAVTFLCIPGAVDDAVRLADGVMYKVKHGGKAAAAFIEYDGDPDGDGDPSRPERRRPHLAEME